MYLFVHNIVWQITLWSVVYVLLQRVGRSSGMTPDLRSPLFSPIAPADLCQDVPCEHMARTISVTSECLLEPVDVRGRHNCWHTCTDVVKPMANLAMLSLAFSFVLASVPSLQSVLFVDISGPFAAVGGAIDNFGAIAPVVGCILLSASLGRSIKMSMEQRTAKATVNPDAVPLWAAIATITIRLFIVPLICLVSMHWFTRFFPLNKTMRMVLGLEFASPSASTTIVICQQLGMVNLADSLAGLYVPMMLLCLLTVPPSLSVALSGV